MKQKATIKNVNKIGTKTRKQVAQLRSNAEKARKAKLEKLRLESLPYEGRVRDEQVLYKAADLGMAAIRRKLYIPHPLKSTAVSILDETTGSMYKRVQESAWNKIPSLMHTSEELGIKVRSPVIKRATKAMMQKWADKLNKSVSEIRSIRKQFFRQQKRHKMGVTKGLNRLIAFFSASEDRKTQLYNELSIARFYHNSRFKTVGLGRSESDILKELDSQSEWWSIFCASLRKKQKTRRRDMSKITNVKQLYRAQRRNYVIRRTGRVLSPSEYQQYCLRFIRKMSLDSEIESALKEAGDFIDLYKLRCELAEVQGEKPVPLTKWNLVKERKIENLEVYFKGKRK